MAAENYAGFSINFADYADAIEPCIGLSVDEFSKQVKNSGDARVTLHFNSQLLCTPLRKTGLGMKLQYTANGLGYWFDGKSNVSSYGDNCVYWLNLVKE